MCSDLLKDKVMDGSGPQREQERLGKAKKEASVNAILPLSDCSGNFCQMLKIMFVVANMVLQAQWRCKDCRAPTRANEMPGPYANS